MKNTKTFFCCTECGYRSPKWIGKCPACGAWNSMEEEAESSDAPASTTRAVLTSGDSGAVSLQDMTIPEYLRSGTGLGELDRVLGGGLVKGSVVLLAGEPGIGKSTLLLQISASLCQTRRVLYVSGEESGGQLKLRAERLGVKGPSLFILTETNVERILAETDKIRPDILIVDSIQTMFHNKISSAPGSVTQVRECAMHFIAKSKSENISTFLVGHVNKEGGIAGPKVLEHMVDAVLYFEGERQQSYRIIRAVKNRFGSTNEIGVFEMTDQGLVQVENPSEMLLAGRPKNISGNCAVSTLEGTRPLIDEGQALVVPTVYPSGKRTSNGIDYNRLCLILAVLEKRMGYRFSGQDVYTNIIGGLRIDEPASDLAVAMALISSYTDRIVPDELIAVGELGLAGECRAVANLEQRVKEAARLGFTVALVPYRNLEKRTVQIQGIRIVPVRGLFEVLPFLKEKDS